MLAPIESPQVVQSGANYYKLLPVYGERHDWELDLAAVVGPDAEVAGYTAVNDLTTRDLVYRPDLKALGTDWLRSKNASTFVPTGGTSCRRR